MILFRFVVASMLVMFVLQHVHASLDNTTRRLKETMVDISPDFNCINDCIVTNAPQQCFQLTPDENHKSGVVWSEEPVEIANSFTVTADLYFGTTDSSEPDYGADGMVFVLQNQGPETVGRQGGGLGFSGIYPSLGAEFDTYSNPLDDLHLDDHISLVEDGRIVDQILAGPVPLSFNLEDGAYHEMVFEWLSNNGTVNVHLDGKLYLSATVDLVGILGSDFAFLGFTASTGDSKNRHEVCIKSIVGTVYVMPSTTPSRMPNIFPSVTPSLPPSLSPAPVIAPVIVTTNQPSKLNKGSMSKTRGKEKSGGGGKKSSGGGMKKRG